MKLDELLSGETPLDAWIAATGIESTRMSQLRAGAVVPRAKEIAAIANVSGLPPVDVIAKFSTQIEKKLATVLSGGSTVRLGRPPKK